MSHHCYKREYNIDDSTRFEIEQRYEFSRHTVQTFVAWFTFWGTLNIVVLGWLVTGSTKPEPIPNYLLVLISIIFVLQNTYAFIASRNMVRFIEESESKIRALIQESSIALPTELYRKGAKLIRDSNFSFICVWLVVPIAVIYMSS